jgi:hypothetical protein
MATHTSSVGTTVPDSADDLEFWEMRKLRFRVLVLGVANAGKTTILERLANASEDDALIFRDGRQLKSHENVCGMIMYDRSNSHCRLAGDQR